MANKYDEYCNTIIPALACGRTLDEQKDFIKTHGNHGVPAVLRGALFKAIGIPSPKEKAENLAVFGCYVPFSEPFLVRDYVRVFDLLGIDYTYLNHEHCCGAPIPAQCPEEDRGKAFATAKEMSQLNVAEASKKGAKTLAYCCLGCVHMNKYASSEATEKQLYVADLIVEKLRDRPLKMAPMEVGYFEGCHVYYNLSFPKAHLDWKRYRQVLGRIEGLKIVDLPKKLCCKTDYAQILEAAKKLAWTQFFALAIRVTRAWETPPKGTFG